MSSKMSEWELLKENVEPIKSGRNMKTLKSALNQRPEELNARELKRKDFESELRTYSGEDLLSVYYDYIQWVEQNYPLGGNEANLKTLLEKCMEQFYASDQYRNDGRLLNVFLKFIKRVDSPLEMFNFFHDNGFATKLSEFYINWSFHLENAKNCRKAAEVLRLGLTQKAEPVASLKRALEELENRVAKAIVNNKMDDLNDNEEDDEKSRQPLNKLKGKTKKGKVEAPVKRVGNVVKKSNDGLKTSANTKKTQNSNNVQNIYCDENDPIVPQKVTTARPEASLAIKSVAAVGAVGQENQQKPEKWSENRIKQKHIKTESKPAFDIHADETDDESPEPMKKPPQSNALKLRPRSADSPPIARFEKPDPLKKFAFNVNKVYAGGEEFSFEEIRGRKWMAKKKREEEVSRSQKLEEEVAQLRLQVELLLKSQQSSQQSQPTVPKKTIQTVPPSVDPHIEIPSLPSSADSSTVKSDPHSSGNASKATMSLMRDLWNGTLATAPIDLPENQKPENKAVIDDNDNELKKREKFFIFSDTSIVTKDMDKRSKARESSGFRPKVRESTGFMDYTLALPKSEQSFITKTGSYSTPVADKTKKDLVFDAEAIKSMQSNVNFVGGMTAKLSPIVETSREYNSKSSSSSSGTMSTTGGSALSRRQRALSGVEHLDPFDVCLLTQLLDSLAEPIDSRKGFSRVNKKLPKIKQRETVIKLGSDKYLIDRLIATGAYAQVFSAQIEDTADSDSDLTNSSGFSQFVSQKWFALKVAKQANEWEFYICDELHKRLTRSKSLPDIELSVMSANPSVMFKDGCVLVDEYAPNGTLIDVVNVCKTADKPFPKTLISYYALELILIVQQLHKNLIIHADIKPDNILVLNFPSREDINNVLKRTTSLKVIDFGRSIDLQLFPEGTAFNVNVTTKGSQCCEMLDSKPWTFQTDWFGVLDCIHVMLFGDYIKVRKNSEQNRWEIIDKLKRYHRSDIWKPLFDTLLNIPDSQQSPDLTQIIDSLNESIKQNITQTIRDGNELEIIIDSQQKKRK